LQGQWNALLTTALLGTEQRKCTVVAPEVEFLNSLPGVDPDGDHEGWVLLASAYAATYRRAGQIPPTMPPTQTLTPAPVETKPYCSALVAARIGGALIEIRTQEPFLEEILLALASKGRIVPPYLLPDLLYWGQRSKQRRALIAPVVGERGQWLTQVNPEWKNALQFDPKEVADQAEAAHKLSGQQALYAALNITENIFSKGFSVLKGQGFSAFGRLIQLTMDKLLTLSKPGGSYFSEQELSKIAVAVPAGALPELTSQIHKALANGEYTWLSKLAEYLELRQQMLEELNLE
jgi:hypothetical protein